jgi:hypothetical protein
MEMYTYFYEARVYSQEDFIETMHYKLRTKLLFFTSGRETLTVLFSCLEFAPGCCGSSCQASSLPSTPQGVAADRILGVLLLCSIGVASEAVGSFSEASRKPLFTA